MKDRDYVLLYVLLVLCVVLFLCILAQLSLLLSSHLSEGGTTLEKFQPAIIRPWVYR